MEPAQKRQRTEMNVSGVFQFTELQAELKVAIFSWMPDLAMILAQVCRQWRALILHTKTDFEIWGAVRLQTWCLRNKDDRLIRYARTARHMATMVKTLDIAAAMPFWKLWPNFFMKLFQILESLVNFPTVVLRAVSNLQFTPYHDKEFDHLFRHQMVYDSQDERIYALARAVIQRQDNLMLRRFFIRYEIKPVYITWAITKGYIRSAVWMTKKELLMSKWQYANVYVVCAAKKNRFQFLKWIWNCQSPHTFSNSFSRGSKQRLAIWTMVHMDHELWDELLKRESLFMKQFADKNKLLYAYFKGNREEFARLFLLHDQMNYGANHYHDSYVKNDASHWNHGLSRSYMFYYTMAMQNKDPIKEVTWLHNIIKIPTSNHHKQLKKIAMGKKVSNRLFDICIPVCSEPALSWLMDFFPSSRKW